MVCAEGQKKTILDPEKPVDFDEVRKNANEQGIDLACICIVYTDLSHDEIEVLKQLNLLAHENHETVTGRFCKNGDVCFPNKAVGVFTLLA